MQVSNGDVWLAAHKPAPGALSPLEELLGAPWPVKTAYALARLARRLNEPYGVAEQVRSKLILQHGTVDEATKQTGIKPSDENWPLFVADYNALMSENVEIDLDKIVLPESDIKVTPNVLLALDAFIEVA